MITEEDKYRAYTYNVAAFAFMAPLGKIFLENIKLFNELGPVCFAISCLISLPLFIIGLTLLELGRRLLCRRKI